MKENPFEDFDQTDDARGAIDENESRRVKIAKNNNLNDASKDLLRRLLEPDPRHRLKSLLAFQRIAFFFNYNFDDVRHLKVRKNRRIVVPSFDHKTSSPQLSVQLNLPSLFFVNENLS